MLKKSKYKTFAVSILFGLPLFSLQAASVGSDPMGVVKTTLPAGANLYTASFVNSLVHVGGLSGISVNAGETTLTASNLANGGYNAGVSYPTHYIEITEDTDNSDGLDTEGLMFDIVSNDGSTLLIDADLTAGGINGDESFVIRAHMTLAQLFADATGFTAYYDNVTLFNSDGTSDIYFYTPSNWLDAYFTLNSDDVVVYPAEGLVLSTQNPATIVNSGHIKLGPTQIPIHGGNQVNIVGFLRPVQIDLEASGLETSASPYFDTVTVFDQSGQLGNELYFWDYSNQLLDAFFTQLPGTVIVEGDNPVVVGANSAFYNKIPAVVISQ